LRNRAAAAEYSRRYRLAHKEQVSQANRAYYLAHREELVEAARAWRIANPEKFREAYQSYRAANIEKVRESQRMYHRLQPDKSREQLRNYRKNHPEKARALIIRSGHIRRARMRGILGSYTAAEWQQRLAEFDGQCAYCGSGKTIGIDHVMPLSRGGTNVIENIVPACKSCNCSKGAKTVEEWLP